MRKPRHRCYVRIYRVGCWWRAYQGWTCQQYWTGNQDLEKLVASIRLHFAGEIQMPSAHVIAAGLPADYQDFTYAAAEWLEANPDACPSLLQMVRATIAGELADRFGIDPEAIQEAEHAALEIAA